MQRLKSSLSALLLLAFFSAAFVNVLHSHYDHHHDVTCNVYVLEQLFVADAAVFTVHIAVIAALFLFVLVLTCNEICAPFMHFLVRAPPSLKLPHDLQNNY